MFVAENETIEMIEMVVVHAKWETMTKGVGRSRMESADGHE